MPVLKSFGKWFREAIAPDSQMEAAAKLDVSQSAVSKWSAGSTPSAQMLERICRVYGRSIEEGLSAAGFGPESSNEAEERLAEIARRAAREAANAVSNAHRLWDGVRSRNERLGRAVSIRLYKGASELTAEDVDSILAALDRRMEEDQEANPPPDVGRRGGVRHAVGD